MPQASALLGLVTETSLHAGAGQTTGAIDLPIQREGHTGWPCVYGSSVKGALRAKAAGVNMPDLEVVFGPGTGNASEYAGALAVGDAKLLLLPVRSLTSHFKWVTCPALLKRVQREMERLGLLAGQDPLAPPQPTRDQAIVPPGAQEGGLFLEEFRFTAKSEELTPVIDLLVRFFTRPGIKEELKQQLVVVHDDLFNHLSRFTTPVNAHVRINNAHKTVDPGALWYEETLPPETLLYVPLVAHPSRKLDSDDVAVKDEQQVLTSVTGGLFGKEAPYLQLGGNETVGMGWCRVTPVTETGAPAGEG